MDPSALVGKEATGEIDFAEARRYNNSTTLQTKSGAYIDTSQDIIAASFPGMNQALSDLQRHWIAMVSGAGHY